MMFKDFNKIFFYFTINLLNNNKKIPSKIVLNDFDYKEKYFIEENIKLHNVMGLKLLIPFLVSNYGFLTLVFFSCDRNNIPDLNKKKVIITSLFFSFLYILTNTVFLFIKFYIFRILWFTFHNLLLGILFLLIKFDLILIKEDFLKIKGLYVVFFGTIVNLLISNILLLSVKKNKILTIDLQKLVAELREDNSMNLVV